MFPRWDQHEEFQPPTTLGSRFRGGDLQGSCKSYQLLKRQSRRRDVSGFHIGCGGHWGTPCLQGTWKMGAVTGAGQEQGVFMEMVIVLIPPPGKAGKILANFVKVQFHPAKAPSDFSVCKEEGLQTRLSTTDPESRLCKLSCPFATLPEDNPQSDSQNQCWALRQPL